MGPPLKLLRRGKVRDIYDLGQELLIVASDRVSAYDVVLPDEIPRKGESLTKLSKYWFTRTGGIIPNHFLECTDERSIRAVKAKRIDIEWVVRSRLYGSMWRAYSKGRREFGGVRLPDGLRMADELPENLLTPTTKSDIGHDLDITRGEAIDQGLLSNDDWRVLEEASFRLYEFYRDEVRKRGMILPDFKVEYGEAQGTLIQIDEPPTHDSARFWAEKYFEHGREQEAHALDKEFLRVFLRDYYGFTGEGPPPRLPRVVVQEVSKRCVGACDVIDGSMQIDNLQLRNLSEVIEELRGEEKSQNIRFQNSADAHLARARKTREESDSDRRRERFRCWEKRKMTESRYEKLGVDIHKKGIEVFKPSIRALFPTAFCAVKHDPQFPEYALVAHADGAGSKPVQSYLNYKETEEAEAFRGIGQDVVAMNLNDILCVGAAPISFVDYVALNKSKVPKEALLKILSEEFAELIELLREYGITLPFDGGETADLPDQLSMLDVSGFMEGRVKLSKVITGERIRSGNKIVGLRSGGRARYEDKLNSGIMCNGITLARHCLITDEYEKKYPEILGHGTPGYSGHFRIRDYVDELEMTVDAAITSPTRIFAPIIIKVLDAVGSSVTGLVHNTGGGQTKCLKLGRGLRYVKHLITQPDPIFNLIQRESNESWRNMYQNFNMGIGFEVILESEAVDAVLSIAEGLGVHAEEIGYVETGPNGNEVVIESSLGKFVYDQT